MLQMPRLIAQLGSRWPQAHLITGSGAPHERCARAAGRLRVAIRLREVRQQQVEQLAVVITKVPGFAGQRYGDVLVGVWVEEKARRSDTRFRSGRRVSW